MGDPFRVDVLPSPSPGVLCTARLLRGDRLAVIPYHVYIAQVGTTIRGDRFAVIPYFVSIAQVGIKRKRLVVDGVATRVAPNGGLELQIMI